MDLQNHREAVLELSRQIYHFFMIIRSNTTKIIGSYGLTRTQFNCLYLLWLQGDMSVGELLRGMDSTSGNLTVVIRNLVRNGYAERVGNSKDRRSYFVHLTDAGRTLMEEVFPKDMEHLGQLFSLISAEKQDQLAGLLREFNGAYEGRTDA